MKTELAPLYTYRFTVYRNFSTVNSGASVLGGSTFLYKEYKDMSINKGSHSLLETEVLLFNIVFPRMHQQTTGFSLAEWI